MDYDQDKVDEAALALLFLTLGAPGPGRAWKCLDWDVSDRLFKKDLISDPRGKAKSVMLTEEGEKRCKELFEKLFGRHNRELL